MAEQETAWVVLGSSGQYSDWSQWIVEVHDSEEAAKDRAVAMGQAYRLLLDERPKETYTDDGNACPEYVAWCSKVRDLDSFADEYDEPNYTAREAPFIRKESSNG